MITRHIRWAWLWAIPALPAGWLAVLATVMVLSDDAPAALVLFPSETFLKTLPPTTAIVGKSPVSITLTGDTEGLTRTLYQSGALLVLPAGLAGCLPNQLMQT